MSFRGAVIHGPAEHPAVTAAPAAAPGAGRGDGHGRPVSGWCGPRLRGHGQPHPAQRARVRIHVDVLLVTVSGR